MYLHPIWRRQLIIGFISKGSLVVCVYRDAKTLLYLISFFSFMETSSNSSVKNMQVALDKTCCITNVFRDIKIFILLVGMLFFLTKSQNNREKLHRMTHKQNRFTSWSHPKKLTMLLGFRRQVTSSLKSKDIMSSTWGLTL